MDDELRGYGESLLVMFVVFAIYLLIGAAVWALAMLVLNVLGVENIWVAGWVTGVVVVAAVISFYFYSYMNLREKFERQESKAKSFFGMFEKDEFENVLRSLKNTPTFRISHHLVISAIFILIALVLIVASFRGTGIYFRNGWLLSTVFIVFVIWLWHSRARSMRLTAWFYTGNNLIARGRAQDALHIANNMLKVRPRGVGGHWLKGNALFAMRDYDRASVEYERSIEYNPASARFLLSFLGLCFQRLGLYQRAGRTYEEALRLNPGAKEVHYGLACNYALMNDPGHAMPHLQKAVELGYVDLDYIKNDPDLDNIRNEPRFRELIEQLSSS